jgi:predicted nucleic acid-binding protein
MSLRRKKVETIIAEAHWELAQEAGRFKAKNQMSFADCFAAALAKDKAANLLTGDKRASESMRPVSFTDPGSCISKHIFSVTH